MELTGKLTFLVLIQFLSTIKLTSAQYCEWGICNSQEYCCGDNICCGNNDVLYHGLITVCIVLAVISLCCSIFFIFRYLCCVGRPMIQLAFSNYRNLPRNRNSSTTNLQAAACDVEYNERMYSDPPPPYSEVVQTRK